MAQSEVLFEFQQIGSFVKVTAIDTLTLVEVSVQGPTWASKEMLKRHALRRLEFVLRRKGLIR